MMLREKIINHILSQNDWMKDELLGFKNKIIRLEVEPFIIHFQVDEKGQLFTINTSKDADTFISISPNAFFKMIITKQKKDINISGDVDFANVFSTIITKTRWDIEEDLSLLVGDIAAVEITKFGNAFIKKSKKGLKSLAEALVEYWQEEEQILVSKYEVEKFYTDVDELQENFSRVEVKLNNILINDSK